MSNELEVKKDSALAKVVKSARGLEEPTNKEDLIIPRVALMQPTSPQMLREGSNFKLGQIINSVTEEILSSEFVPVFKFTRWMRFNPRKKDDQNFDPAFDPAAEIWRSNDPNDIRVLAEGKFGPNGERPLATKFLNFFCYFVGCPMPVIVSFCNTSFKAGKKLLSLCVYDGKDIFTKKYKLTSKVTSNDLGTFAVFDIAPAGLASEAEYKRAESWYEQFAEKAKEIEVHSEEEVSTEEVPT